MAQEEKNIPENEIEAQQVPEQPEAVDAVEKAEVKEPTVQATEAPKDDVEQASAPKEEVPKAEDGQEGQADKESGKFSEKKEVAVESRGRPERPVRAGRGKGRRESKSKTLGASESEFIEKVLSIRRVTKVTKGGKKLSFSALVVVGDGKSRVGYAQEKAGEVAIAIRKAMAAAKKNMVKVPLKGTTIPHEIIGAWGGARVLLKPASEGTGVIASGPVRAICDGAGIHNILTKCHRSNNPVNVVKATINGLTSLKIVNKSI